jgi:RNA polymerase sigma-70 factor (ECF subfamily)
MNETNSLIRRAREGERHALERLLSQFDRDVFGLAVLILGDREDAQDAAQEVLIKVFRKLESYDGRSAFRTWLYRLTVNTCRDALRRRARRREARLVDALPAAQAGPLQTELHRERQQAVWRAVQSLDGVVREAVILRYYLGLPCAQIGEVTEAPVNTVYWRLHQARKRLEPLLMADDILGEELGARREKEGGR